MEVLFSKKIKSDLTKLGLYQIVGGVLGIIIIIWAILKIPLLTDLAALVYFIMVLFFAYSIFCGVLCIKTKKNSLLHSLINQMLQIFGIAIMGYALKYVAGFYLTIGLNLTDSIKFTFGTGLSKFDFNINLEKERLELDFNLIAFAFVYWIDKLMQKVKEEESVRQAFSIGET